MGMSPAQKRDFCTRVSFFFAHLFLMKPMPLLFIFHGPHAQHLLMNERIYTTTVCTHRFLILFFHIYHGDNGIFGACYVIGTEFTHTYIVSILKLLLLFSLVLQMGKPSLRGVNLLKIRQEVPMFQQSYKLPLFQSQLWISLHLPKVTACCPDTRISRSNVHTMKGSRERKVRKLGNLSSES